MELATQAYPIAMLLAFALGALSFLSPCVLPIVPPYLAYMSGVRMDEIEHPDAKRKLIVSASFFVLGLSTVFLLLALAVNRLANFLIAYQGIINVIAGSIIIIFGLHFLGVFKLGFLDREVRVDAKSDSSPIGAYLLGLAFALGWSPCLGPALSAILGMVAQEETLGRGMILMVIYALGLGLPFVLTAMLIERFMKASGSLKKHIPTLKIIMGVVLIVIGLLMVTGNFIEISNWILDHLPFMSAIG